MTASDYDELTAWFPSNLTGVTYEADVSYYCLYWSNFIWASVVLFFSFPGCVKYCFKYWNSHCPVFLKFYWIWVLVWRCLDLGFLSFWFLCYWKGGLLWDVPIVYQNSPFYSTWVILYFDNKKDHPISQSTITISSYLLIEKRWDMV